MNLFNDSSSPPFLLPNKEGYSMNFDEKLKGFLIKIPNGELFYSEHFFDKKISDRCVEYFLENESNNWQKANWKTLEKEKLSEVNFKNINWRHDEITIYGKKVFIPRFSAWYGDSKNTYTYSGLTLQPNPWNKGLNYIKNKVDKVTKLAFNSVLLNWYRDGNDHMSWHADNEKELGINPVIGSVNFGETRRFLMRRNDNNKMKIEFPLKHGTLLIMRGELQHYWQHSVPKERKVKGSRFNLTFRIIKH